MQNLEQIRAAKALETAPKTTKAAVNKLPAMILSNGLLAACAFANEQKEGNHPKRPDMKAALDGVAQHLARTEIGFAELYGCRDVGQLTDKLSKSSSLVCQRATDEAIAFLAYVKRFATRDGVTDQGVS